jgi:arylsulfatase A-like enzyme
VVPGRDRLGYYVAQYDGEIAAVDAEVGRFLGALAASDAAANTMVVVTSDHGESLGEHGYYFDHGEDLFDPSLRVPLIVRVPGGRRGVRAGGLVSTLDLVPTILDAVKVSYPPDLAGRSLLRALVGPSEPGAPRLAARNDRNLSAVWDSSGKIVAHPTEDGHRLALYDRAADPGETRDVARERPDVLRPWRREMELFVERHDRERARTEALLQGRTTTVTVSPETCALLKTLGYVTPECPGG